MGINITTYDPGDMVMYAGPYSWPTYSYADADAAFNGAIADMEADAWDFGEEALLIAGTKITASWSGQNHLRRDATTGHLMYDATTGHLRRKLDLDGEGYTTRVILDKYLTTAYKGTTVTGVAFNWTGVAENISNVDDYTVVVVSFHPSAASSPTSDWAWMFTSPQVAFAFSAGAHSFSGSLSGGSFVLDDWLYVCYGLQEYDVRPEGVYNPVPSPTATVSNVGVGLDNAMTLNP